jgi:UDP-GlcNAc3NAcA epimerase
VNILTVVGNRPQFIKAAALSGLLRERHHEVLVHTGQHHDDALSRVFFTELGLAKPEHELAIAGGSNTSQTARMLSALEPVLAQARPDAVLVYGDTNSTLAGALAGAQGGWPVIHVEAGMRAFDMTMPEERNRIVADHLATLLLCPSERSAQNLRAEGIGAPGGPAARVEVVGDVMVDVALRWQPRARQDTATLARYNLRAGEYLLLTAHRAANVDPPDRLRALLELIRMLAAARQFGPVVFPLHPRTRARLHGAHLYDELAATRGLVLIDPLPYAPTSALLCNARAILTDSGGMQKEAYLARVPCMTLRERTEWTETVQAGWNVLVDLDPAAVLRALAAPLPAEHPPLYGCGDAAPRCLAAIDWLAR